MPKKLHTRRVFPAHAGVIPSNEDNYSKGDCFPRTRGGDPKLKELKGFVCEFSPHTRG